MKNTGQIFDIQSLSIHDGPGIRTTVFLKGCPLRCVWCHNPESQKEMTEIFFSPERCSGCRSCVQVCPQQCHRFDAVHLFDRTGCIRCGSCTENCFSEALVKVGRAMSVNEVLQQVLADRPFYGSNGGLTVSGGEPMAQFDFTLQLVREAKKHGLHICLDTCGYAAWEKYELLLPYIDIFLYDIKASDPAKHKAFTGVELSLIQENLRKLDAAGAVIYLRCPLIPGLNDEKTHWQQLGKLAESLHHVEEITLHPYHPLGIEKNKHLGAEVPFNCAEFASADAVQQAAEVIAAETTVRIQKR